MKIDQWYITGDCHGRVAERVQAIPKDDTIKGLIILGDSGFNFFKDERGDLIKDLASERRDIFYYCVRGNHEDRIENMEKVEKTFDGNVGFYIKYQPRRWHNIRYLEDGTIYYINGNRTLVLGGAYSVDKFYRLENGWTWYPQEQMSEEEREFVDLLLLAEDDKKFDVVLTHTCPYSWMPRDLFLPQVDQSKVDNTMEHWLETVKDKIEFDHWYFGHFHDDRFIFDKAEMLYTSIKEFPRGPHE